MYIWLALLRAGVSIWPYQDTLASLQMGQGLTIWLHTQVGAQAGTGPIAMTPICLRMQ